MIQKVKQFSILSYTFFVEMATRIWSITSHLRNFWRQPFSVKNFSPSPKALGGSTNPDPEEMAKFSRFAKTWWNNPHCVLRKLNSLRVPLVRDFLSCTSEVSINKTLPLEGYKIVDVGCGVGFFAESLARLGAQVTGLDPCLDAIEAAKEHASQDEEIKTRLNYVCDTIENFVKVSPGQFDAVVCSEVLDHVPDVPTFVSLCVELAKEGVPLFFTTINRTIASYFKQIFLPEYVKNCVPRGTHEWNKFVQPSELSEILKSLNCRIVSVKGTNYNNWTKTWSWCSSTSVGYALHAIKL